MGHLEHKKLSPAVAHVYILTISDTRTEATDTSGRAIFDLLWADGHQVTRAQDGAGTSRRRCARPSAPNSPTLTSR